MSDEELIKNLIESLRELGFTGEVELSIGSSVPVPVTDIPVYREVHDDGSVWYNHSKILAQYRGEKK